ncbi:pre-mRNA-splicing factor 38B-like [Dorcoceras hygrometricum]|uniref:Pre-mRNA-splicing factor 38B-like n=1 Tax=Dorcoceras hygrometricum TaxID=472368 RepID=A0A2Z7B3X1_9LAMI|nr:pre-mRNA-splicing factor 38B-like [Dorcoceras hygrometricum]
MNPKFEKFCDFHMDYDHTTSEYQHLDQELQSIIQCNPDVRAILSGGGPTRPQKRCREERSWQCDRKAARRDKADQRKIQNPFPGETRSPHPRGFIHVILSHGADGTRVYRVVPVQTLCLETLPKTGGSYSTSAIVICADLISVQEHVLEKEDRRSWQCDRKAARRDKADQRKIQNPFPGETRSPHPRGFIHVIFSVNVLFKGAMEQMELGCIVWFQSRPFVWRHSLKPVGVIQPGSLSRCPLCLQCDIGKTNYGCLHSCGFSATRKLKFPNKAAKTQGHSYLSAQGGNHMNLVEEDFQLTTEEVEEEMILVPPTGITNIAQTLL